MAAFCECGNEPSVSIKCGELLTSLGMLASQEGSAGWCYLAMFMVNFVLRCQFMPWSMTLTLMVS